MSETVGARRATPAARLALLAVLACAVASVCAASGARADPRFGDSAWVAPTPLTEEDSTTDGPRVAPPDHERGWETALRAPFRVVFFPLRLVAMGLEAGAGYVGPRYLEPKAKQPPKRGPALGPYITPSAANDIGLGVALTWAGLPTADSRLRLASAWSTNDRRRLQFSEELGVRRPVGFGLIFDYDYRPDRRYYGIGNDTPEADVSFYLLSSTRVDAVLLLGASPLRQLRFTGGYSWMSPGRGTHGQPQLEDVFTPASTPYLGQATQELSYGVSGDLAALDDERDPSRGVHGRVDLRSVAGLRSGDPDYNQWRLEGRAYLPVFAKRRVIAVRGVYAGVDPRGGAASGLPFYRLAQSEGTSHFAGYYTGRFRDQQLIVARIEYRWIIIFRMSAIALYELGEVAPSTGSFNLRGAHSSWGGGLRLGVRDNSTLRFELATSVEGPRAVLAVGSDF